MSKVSERIIKSQDFKCAFCGLNCTANKMETKTETAGISEVGNHVVLIHDLPSCEDFLNMSAPDFMRAGQQKIIDERKKA